MVGSGIRNALGLCAIRFTRCQANGTPDYSSATGAWALRGNLAQLKWTAQYVTGDDIAELDACGGLAVVRKYPDRLKRMDVEIDFLNISDEAREIIYDAALLLDGSDVIGHSDLVDTACGAGAQHNGVIIEGWAESWQCNQPDADFPYQRVVFTRAYMVPSDGTLAKGVNHTVIKGFSIPNSNIGTGPFHDLPTDLDPDAVRLQFKDTVLPTAGVDGAYLTTPSAT